ncbi:MerR family transcriptional regulator [Kitasatospora sp. NPDC051853]|uniref:MerR family transcriptional regulator n=1 Tax=Kitasatospora sp. NPDC051853 TaxID=3364058 RepID=UPI0037A612DE
MTDTDVVLTPAQAVAESGFSLDTLRYYERIGLLGEVRRSASGHRRFTAHDLAWLGVLRCLRDTGMPISDMLDYAELVRAGDGTVTQRLAILEAHDEQVEARIRELQRQRQAIRDKIAYYREVL